MFQSITTGRLVLRTPALSDLDALVERRNDPAVAKYQDWLLPFEQEAGRELLTGAEAMGGPRPDDWWMISVVDRQRPTDPPLGDLGLHISADGRVATIGYTFATTHHGNGYATEAVEALLDYLFNTADVLRATASLHPDNTASAQVLERNGFEFEGHSRASHWRGDGPDAENSDAWYYGLNRDAYLAWRARPTEPPTAVRLIPVTEDNFWPISKLRTHKSQEQFVAPVLVSYADALFPEKVNNFPVLPWMRAIEADDELAGFVMVAWRTEHHPNPYLWRLLIDRRHQRRGVGSAALDLVEDECRANGDVAIEVSWTEGRGSPAAFYEARGYVRTGNLIDGETEAVKQLLSSNPPDVGGGA